MTEEITDYLHDIDSETLNVVSVRIIADDTPTLPHADTAEFGDGQTFQVPLASAGTGPVQLLLRRPKRHRAILYAGPLPSGVTILLASRIDFLQGLAPVRGYTLQVTGQQLEIKNQEPWYAIAVGAASAPVQPAVPASTVAAQNTSSYAVSVVISGGAATVTTVNGIVVGAGDGTYLVPSGGSIAVTYTIAPAWVWSNASSNLTGPFAVSVLDEGYAVS
jgi:hypothetical protein